MSISPPQSLQDEQDPLINEIDPESQSQQPRLFKLNFCGILVTFKKRNLCKLLSVILVVLLAITTTFITVYVKLSHPRTIQTPPPRNVIMMISDGFGPASQTLARQYSSLFTNNTTLPLDTLLKGSIRTHSHSSLITDSAAGATSFSCGLKTYNGAIGVDSTGHACGTVLEACKRKGMVTGIVVTSRITHATPAAFSAHVLGRDDESLIAKGQIGMNRIGRMVDLFYGGGKCMFIGNSSSKSCRNDDLDLFGLAEEKYGWNIGDGLKEFEEMDTLPLMNLFAEDHLPYEIDRDESVPSLATMAERALKVLNMNSKKSNTGFFLMIEGSRIDMAAHSNDPAAHVHEILAYNEAISVVEKFVIDNPDTVMISTSDHETGGFTVGHQLGKEYPVYSWDPQVLVPVIKSGEYIANQILRLPFPFSRKVFVKTIVFKLWLGIFDSTPAEIETFMGDSLTQADLEYAVGKVVSDRAGLGW
jgi:alkaline phosphatase